MHGLFEEAFDFNPGGRAARGSVALIESCPFTRQALAKVMAREFSHLAFRSFASTQEANEAEDFLTSATAVVANGKLPDGSGIDLLADVLTVNPDVFGIVLLERKDLRGLEVKGWMEDLHFLERPVDRRRFSHLISLAAGLYASAAIR